MKKYKTFLSIIVLLVIIMICSLSAFASVTSETYTIWNAKETGAYAKTVGNAPTGTSYYVYADITSNTGDHSYSSTDAPNGGTAIAQTGTVYVEYGAGMPLVTVYGGHG